MPEAIAAPPPAAKPSAPAKPELTPSTKSEKPAAKTTPVIEPPESHALQDDFDELAALHEESKPEKETPDKPSKPKAEKEEETDDSDKAKANGDPKAKGDKSKEGDEAELKTPKELREAYKALKEKVSKDYEPKLKRLPELEAKVKELESRDESSAKATQSEIAAVKKRNEELENHIRFVDYEKSTEYRDQFQKPYEDAWGSALRELKGLTMKIEDPKSGEEIVREVTQADIAYFANLDPATRRTEINRLFPEDREEVKRHINQISNLAEKANAAREKAKADAETHAKTQTEAQRQAQIQRTKLWQETNKSLAEKYPKWFGRDESDEEGNAILDKGRALTDLLFDPASLTQERIQLLPKRFKEAIESSKPFSPEDHARLHAVIANKAANHDRAITKLKSAQARIAELEKSLKEYEDSGPDKIPVGGRRPAMDDSMTDEEEIRALDRK